MFSCGEFLPLGNKKKVVGGGRGVICPKILLGEKSHKSPYLDKKNLNSPYLDHRFLSVTSR